MSGQQAVDPASRPFHGFLVTVGEVAAVIVRRLGHPEALTTPDERTALLEMLSGWDLERVTEWDEGMQDRTQAASYLAAPEWLRDLVKDVSRTGHAVTTGLATRPFYISAIVPGIHWWEPQPDDAALAVLVSDEVGRQLAGMSPPTRGLKPCHITFTRSGYPEGDAGLKARIKLGRWQDMHHVVDMEVPGGIHARPRDIAREAEHVVREVEDRRTWRRLLKEVFGTIVDEAAHQAALEPAMTIRRISLLSVTTGAPAPWRERDRDWLRGISAVVEVESPDHALRMRTTEVYAHNSIHHEATRWHPFEYQCYPLEDLRRLTGRILSGGEGMRVDPVLDAALAAIPPRLRRDIVEAAMRLGGKSEKGRILAGTPIRRIKAVKGVLTGAVAIGDGVEWVEGVLRVDTRKLHLSSTIEMALVGKPLRSLVDNTLLPGDAAIRKVDRQSASYKVTVEAAAVPLVTGGGATGRGRRRHPTDGGGDRAS